MLEINASKIYFPNYFTLKNRKCRIHWKASNAFILF